LIEVTDKTWPKLITRDTHVNSRPYIALSYVWGIAQPYVLSKGNVREMHFGLAPSRLPKSIQDAIQVTVSLGFKYLWVDALCIIQDSAEDKARELPTMAAIYRHSALTIIAASASACTKGFLRPPEPPQFFVEPFKVPVNTENGQKASLLLGYREYYKSGWDPINSRAWTLQERVLSSRSLIFSNSGIIWVCGESHYNPSAPPDAPPPFIVSLNRSIDDDEDYEAAIREQWLAILGEYTERSLTVLGDKLPAISALAAEVAQRTNWTYLAGLWEENLFFDLHWKYTKTNEPSCPLKTQKAKDAGYIAPSWSRINVAEGLTRDTEDERNDRQAFHFRILDCQVELADNSDFQFGPVKDGFLEVEGKVIDLAWKLDDSPEWVDSDLVLLDDSLPEQTYIVGEGTLDPLDKEIPADARIKCLGMSTIQLGNQRIAPIEGLMILSTGLDGNFRRVGFCRITAPSVFDDAAKGIFRIV